MSEPCPVPPLLSAAAGARTGTSSGPAVPLQWVLCRALAWARPSAGPVGCPRGLGTAQARSSALPMWPRGAGLSSGGCWGGLCWGLVCRTCSGLGVSVLRGGGSRRGLPGVEGWLRRSLLHPGLGCFFPMGGGKGSEMNRCCRDLPTPPAPLSCPCSIVLCREELGTSASRLAAGWAVAALPGRAATTSG